MGHTILALVVLAVIGAGLMYLLGGVSDTRTRDFKAHASDGERAIARSLDRVPWDSPAIAELLPVDADGEALRPCVASVDAHPRGVEIRWSFPAGYGADDWNRLWPRLESHLPGTDPMRVTGVSRSGATVVVETRDPLDGTRRSSWS